MNVNCPTTTQFSITPSTSLYDVSRHTVHNDARRTCAKLSKVGDYSRRAINNTTTFVMGVVILIVLCRNALRLASECIGLTKLLLRTVVGHVTDRERVSIET